MPRLRPAEKWFRELPPTLQDHLQMVYCMAAVLELLRDPERVRELRELIRQQREETET